MIIYTEHDFEDDIELDGSTSVFSPLGQVHIAHWPRAERKLRAIRRSVSVGKGWELLKLTEGLTLTSTVRFHSSMSYNQECS